MSTNPDEVDAGPDATPAPDAPATPAAIPWPGRPAGDFRINGKWSGGAFLLVGPAQDFLDIGAIITAAAASPDVSGLCRLAFDGQGQPPLKQAGN
jgi:hypothetical protein